FQDEQLITPVLNLSPAVNVTLEFDQNFDWSSGGQNEVGDVDVMSSRTGGSWTNVFRNIGNSSQNPDHRTVTISSQSAGASNVQIRFHYYSASEDHWWQVDNVVVNYTGPSTCAQHVCTAPPSADLSVTKTDSPDPVATGGTITYTVTVTNSGPN